VCCTGHSGCIEASNRGSKTPIAGDCMLYALRTYIQYTYNMLLGTPFKSGNSNGNAIGYGLPSIVLLAPVPISKNLPLL
jgi:hypothetical protein